MKGIVIVVSAWLFLCAEVSAQGHYYRFINDEGVKVLGHSIPPEFVHKGYEIISATGRVIEVVAPAPDATEIEEERARAELEAKYEQLAKRYSTERDLVAAKNRKLVHVDASIVLVQKSIQSTQSDINDITRRAAEFERAGKPVPADILNNLKILNEKMAATQATLKSREEEKKTIVDRFDEDLQLFLSRSGTKVNEANSSSLSSSSQSTSAAEVESSDTSAKP